MLEAATWRPPLPTTKGACRSVLFLRGVRRDMKPVYQDRMGYGQGNCVWACIASIFEIPLELLRYPPPCETVLRRWTAREQPYLQFHYTDLSTNYRLVEGYPDVPGVGTARWAYDVREPDDYDPPEAEFWIASIPSPVLKRPIEDSYYPMPALHAVVMQGRECVHDPHPDYAINPYPRVAAAARWTPLEVGRDAAVRPLQPA
jgi:hypothetical protein